MRQAAELDWASVLPAVVIYLHVYAGTDETGVARTEEVAPVTTEWVARHFAGGQSNVTIKPVIDLAGMAPVDAYEVPDRHREAVHLMTPADTFPWGSCTTRAQQVDHTDPFIRGKPAQSGIGNYGPMTTSHHRLKTHAGWEVKQPFPGIYLWRDPHGATYLVDHTGTRHTLAA